MTSILLLHTTETTDGTIDTLARIMPQNGSEPHALFQPSDSREIICRQPWESAKALYNKAGGVETNRRERDGKAGCDVYQVEIIHRAGTERDNQWYINLANYVRAKASELGVPLIFPYRFASSYGDNVRLSFDEWNDPNLTGIIGHCHVPENDHWDPTFDVMRLIFALNYKEEDDDMTPAEFAVAIGETGAPDSPVRLINGVVCVRLLERFTETGESVFGYYPLGAALAWSHQEAATHRMKGYPASVNTSAFPPANVNVSASDLESAVVRALTNNPLAPKKG